MTPTPALPWAYRLPVALLAGGSIAALLADLYDVARASVVFWLFSVPSMVMLAVLAVVPRVNSELRLRIRVGAFAGLVGTLGYDIIRVPFVIAGQRLFAPIESYGLLIADATSSAGLTSMLGWLYHLSNGVTFGIAYAAIAARWRWPWGVAWGLVLESVAVFSPFAQRYGIAGQLIPISIAYGAHVFYGYPLGRLIQDIDRVDDALRRLSRHSVAAVLVASVLLIAGWHRPWSSTAAEREASSHSTAGAPVTIVERDRFEPEWVRVSAGGCAIVDNRSGMRYETPFGIVQASGQSRLCFERPGVFRVRLGGRPYSGGFVYVDSVRGSPPSAAAAPFLAVIHQDAPDGPTRP